MSLNPFLTLLTYFITLKATLSRYKFVILQRICVLCEVKQPHKATPNL